MGKKRKTRQEKIIAELRRELARQSREPSLESAHQLTRQGAKISEAKITLTEPKKEKKDGLQPLLFTNTFLKKDLAKTLLLTVLILSLEFVLYLKLG